MSSKTLGFVVVDIDSTLADTRQRHGKSPHSDPSATWLSYGLLCADDVPIIGTVRTVQMLFQAGHTIHIVTGRGEEVRVLTEKWLIKNGIFFHSLTMRQEHESEDHVEYKRSHLLRLKKHESLPALLAIEDWPDVVEMYEAEGVPTLCINPRYRSDPQAHWDLMAKKKAEASTL
jgi:hypothetical protein